MKLRYLISLLLVFGFAGTASAVPEKIELPDMKQDMIKVAKKLIDVCDGEGQSTLAVGQFASRAAGANYGPGLEELLRLSLDSTKKGIVQPKAELTISGSYTIVDDPRLSVQMSIEVFNRRNERIKEFIAELTGNADIAKVVGATASLPPEGTKQERNEAIKRQYENPQVYIDGPHVYAKQGSPWAVSIRTKPVGAPGDYVPRNPTIDGGQAYVPIAQGDVYEIVLHNYSDREVACAVSIDGLNAFAFSEYRNPETNQPEYNYYVCEPKRDAYVQGWYLRKDGPDNYASFLVTEYGHGASARMPMQSQGNTGVITVAISYTAPAGKGRAGSETGFGPPRTVEVKPVERSIDPPHEFITIRYAK